VVTDFVGTEGKRVMSDNGPDNIGGLRMLNREAVDKVITELVAQFPNRWRQALANPKLRAWFVNKVMRACGYTKLKEWSAISYAIDKRASREG